MPLEKSYYINTAGDGRLGADTTAADVDAMFEKLRGADQLVIHFHGGLVSKAGGLATAARLRTEYEQFAHPVFFVWEAGITESPVNNLDELVAGLAAVAEEAVFKKLSSVISKWTVGKLGTGEGTKGVDGQLHLPDDISHAIEMSKVERDQIPYADFVPLPPEEVGEVDDPEEQGLRLELERDTDFIADVEAILVDHVEGDDELKAALPAVDPVSTRMDPVVLDELAGQIDPASKGVFSAAMLAKHAAAVFARVVKRFLRHRDHGVYPTVFEELVRELYLASVGGVIWDIMKQDTADTFVRTPGEVRGGELFLRKLVELGDERPGKIVLVGHSTGAVFINEMLKATRALRTSGELPADFSYTGVVFLAPACTFDHFAQVVPKDGEHPLFQGFRMFTMDDAHEQADRLAGFVYPHSLLYFVSGVVEREPDGSSASDMPLVGMNRYYGLDPDRPDAYADLGPSIASVRGFVDDSRVVWSPSAAGSAAGHQSDAVHHGGFDDTGNDQGGHPLPRAAIDSVRYLLEHGYAQ